MHLSVRELQKSDIPSLVAYWRDAEEAHLLGMGVDLAKMPAPEALTAMLSEQVDRPHREKASYCLIWEVDGQAVGHTNINRIRFGEEAYMHLHLWTPRLRRKGHGTALVQLAVPFYFRHYELQTLVCEPYALNPAPNRTLEKAGFTFVREYRTIPGSINFEQAVKRWELTRQAFEKLVPSF